MQPNAASAYTPGFKDNFTTLNIPIKATWHARSINWLTPTIWLFSATFLLRIQHVGKLLHSLTDPCRNKSSMPFSWWLPRWIMCWWWESVFRSDRNAFCATPPRQWSKIHLWAKQIIDGWRKEHAITQHRSPARPPNLSAEMYKWLCASQTIISAEMDAIVMRRHQSARVIYLNAAIFHRHSEWLHERERDAGNIFCVSPSFAVCVAMPGKKRARAHHTHTQSIKFVCRMKRAKRNFARCVRNNFCINASSTLSVFFLSLTRYICASAASLRLMYLNVWRKRLRARTTPQRENNISLCVFAHSLARSLADTSKGHRRLISSSD